MPIGNYLTGNNITAAQFNELVDSYNKLWSDDYTTVLPSDTDKTTHIFGWGQTQVDTVDPQTIITADHTNHLLSQINAGIWHITGNQTLLQPKRSASTAISASVYTSIYNVISTTITTMKLLINADSVLLDTGLSSTDSAGLVWADDLQCTQMFEFSNYNEARYFFNSGGQITVDMSTSNGGSYTPSAVWNAFFDNLGVVRIGATSTTNDGDGDGDAPFNSSVFRGFYNAVESVDTIIYDIAANDGGSLVGDTVDYGAYSSGEYSARRLQLSLRTEMVSGKFQVFLTITLIEDVDDESPVNANIVCNLGYRLPLSTPTVTDSVASSYFTVDSISYVFAQRIAPTITEITAWGPV